MAQAAKSLKIGWLPSRFGCATVARMRFAFAATLVAMTAAPAPAQTVLYSGGRWAAIDFGARCEARSAALSPRRGTRPLAGFAFDPGGRLQGRFYVHLSRPARDGATVVATIGTQPFLLAARGQWAWSRGEQQQRAMLEAARNAQSMRVETRGRDGGRVVDRYLLAGAPTAIDAAAAACAGKSARQ